MCIFAKNSKWSSAADWGDEWVIRWRCRLESCFVTVMNFFFCFCRAVGRG